MRATLVLILLLFSACGKWVGTAHAASTAGRIESVDFSGKRYVRLEDWAKLNNFDIRWMGHDETLQLTNRSSRLVFNKDSREAQLNGVNVCLSHPILLRNGGSYISKLDLETAVHPLVWPPLNRSGAKVKTIVIDPGHGGKDPGFENGSHQEKKYTLLLAQELCDQLKRAGFNASLTRTTDTKIELPERPDIARRRGADLFISLHWNSVGGSKNEVKGVQTFCLTPPGASSSNAGGEIIDAGAKPGNLNNAKNMFLAYELQKSLLKNLGTQDRGVRRARFAVLCPAEMPAVLIEGGFMSHPTESKRIYDPAYRRDMARAIVEGVQDYKRQVEPARSGK
ncbi:MAG: Cell wall hydrolase/autolysin [Pedosphaera sp.]|nr:Cell wall hydrolase/autolysin [Pedosphaera sp.]